MEKIGNVIWIWGMSGSGKTTLGFRLAQELGYTFLDSDSVRRILNIPPDFSVSGRLEYQTALRHHVQGLQQRGVNLVVASITPMHEMRNQNKALLKNYFEVYLDCGIDTLIDRDPKGFYKKAFAGEIVEFTGINSPFEKPVIDSRNSVPKLILDTGESGEEICYKILLEAVTKIYRLDKR